MRMMMNLDNFFNTLPENNESPKKTMSDLMDSPFIWVGTFEKLITNYLSFSVDLISFFKSAIPDLDEEQLKESGKELVCNKAYNYLDKLDLEDETHLESLRIRSSEKLIKTLKFVLYYFESIEEFEKCMKLKKILDYVEQNI
jgi:hypothetical protein